MTYLIPVLLHTAFCPARKRLKASLSLSPSLYFVPLLMLSRTSKKFHTFAISAQLLPASLIVLSLCSSAAVHGVLVRLFFAGGCMGGDDVSGSAMLDEGPAAGAMGLDSDCPEERRLVRGLVGASVSCFGEFSAATGAVGWEGVSILGRSMRFDIVRWNGY
jgi:hypothetical protein